MPIAAQTTGSLAWGGRQAHDTDPKRSRHLSVSEPTLNLVTRQYPDIYPTPTFSCLSGRRSLAASRQSCALRHRGAGKNKQTVIDATQVIRMTQVAPWIETMLRNQPINDNAHLRVVGS